jgi:hypothetical protein
VCFVLLAAIFNRFGVSIRKFPAGVLCCIMLPENFGIARWSKNRRQDAGATSASLP